MKTITFDEAIYRLVPVEATGDMFRAAGKIDDECFAGGNDHGASDEQIYDAMLAAVPDDLPGVVVHSGEPAAFVDESDDGVFADLLMGKDGIHVKRGDLLFTHPPAQPDTAALQARIAELEAQLAAQAGQYPSTQAVLPPNTQPLIAEAARDDGGTHLSHTAKDVIERAADALEDLGAPHNADELRAVLNEHSNGKRDDVAGGASATLQEVTKLVDDWEGYALSACGDERNGDLCGFIAKIRAAIADSKEAQ